MIKIMSICFLGGVLIAFIWCLAELTIETIKEWNNGDKK